MAANELIDHLEMWGTFDKAMIKKLRQKVKNTPKEPTAQALLNYLVKKGVISTSESEDLLTKYLNDPGQDSAVLLQEDLANPDGALDGADNETVLDMGNFGGGSNGDSDDSSDDSGSGSGSNSEYSFSSKYTKEKNWGSIWIYVGTASLILLSGVVFGLYHFLTKISAEEMYKRGANAYRDSSFADARKKLTDFINVYSSDDRASDAVVMRAICEIYVPFKNRSFSVALTKAEEELKKIENQSAFNNHSGDIADLLPKIARTIAATAKSSTDFDKKLEFKEKAIRAMALVNNTLYVPTKKKTGTVQKNIQLATEDLAIVDRQLNVEKNKTESISSIKDSVSKGDTAEGYKVYRRLVSEFPELAVNKDVLQIRDEIRDKEGSLVTVSDSAIEPGQLAKNESEILVASVLGNKINVSDQNCFPVISDGTLYSLQASSGNPTWRMFLGYKFIHRPVEIQNESSVDWVVSRSIDNSIVLLDGLSGKAKWTSNIGEEFLRPVPGNGFLIVSTKSGKVHRINLATGKGEKTAQIPQEISASGVLMSKGSFLYQPGDHWFLYVIDTRTMECKETFLLSHDPGTIKHSPISQRDFLYIAESHPTNSKLHVLQWKTRGRDFSRPQPAFNLPGNILSTPVSFGRSDVVVTDDRGSIEMFSNIGDENQRPVQKALSTTYTASPGIITKSVVARTGDMYLAGRGLGHFIISKARGKIDAKPGFDQNAVFLDPVSFVEDTVIHNRKRYGNSILTITAADRTKLTPKWTTDLGAPLAGLPFEFGGKSYVINSIGDQFEFTPTGQAGTTLAKRIQQGSTTRQSLQIDQMIVSEKGFGLGSLNKHGQNFLIFSMPGSGGALKSRISKWPEAYSPLSCSPVLMGETGIIASEKGVVGLIDLHNSSIAPGGFRPQLPPGSTVQWIAPAVIDASRFVIATKKGRIFLLEVVNGGLVKRVEREFHDTDIVGNLVASGMSTITAMRTKNDGANSGSSIDALKLLDAELKESGSLNLPSQVTAGPWIGDKNVLVQCDGNQLQLTNTQLGGLKAVDSSKFGNIIGKPVFEDGKWHIITTQRKFVVFDAQTGEVSKTVSIGQPIHTGPVKIGNHWMVTTRDGALITIPNK